MPTALQPSVSRQPEMQKNQLYMLIGALAVVVIGLGIYV